MYTDLCVYIYMKEEIQMIKLVVQNSNKCIWRKEQNRNCFETPIFMICPPKLLDTQFQQKRVDSFSLFLQGDVGPAGSVGVAGEPGLRVSTRNHFHALLTFFRDSKLSLKTSNICNKPFWYIIKNVCVYFIISKLPGKLCSHRNLVAFRVLPLSTLFSESGSAEPFPKMESLGLSLMLG